MGGWTVIAAGWRLGVAGVAHAHDNYEIQVYGYDMVEKGHAMVELHSNFTFQGSKTAQDGVLPTNHQLHETIEIALGFIDWFETGLHLHLRKRWTGD